MIPENGIARFERIAEVYDATRDPVDPETLGGLVEHLRKEDCRSLLEIGVGTGRIALPLSEAGFEVTGIDPARNMLRRARSKGMVRLVRGSGQSLPFVSDSFDAALLVHVLHVLPDPVVVLRRAGRVSRKSVLSLLSERSDFSLPSEAAGTFDPRPLLRQVVREAGVARPNRQNPSVGEQSAVRRFPPDFDYLLSDRWVREPLDCHLTRLAHRAAFPGAPESTTVALQRAIESVRRSLGNPLLRYRRRHRLVGWNAERLKLSEN